MPSLWWRHIGRLPLRLFESAQIQHSQATLDRVAAPGLTETGHRPTRSWAELLGRTELPWLFGRDVAAVMKWRWAENKGNHLWQNSQWGSGSILMPCLAEPHCCFLDPDLPRIILLPVFLKYHFHQVNFPSWDPPQLPTPTVQNKFQTPRSALQSPPQPYLTYLLKFGSHYSHKP